MQLYCIGMPRIFESVDSVNTRNRTTEQINKGITGRYTI